MYTQYYNINVSVIDILTLCLLTYSFTRLVRDLDTCHILIYVLAFLIRYNDTVFCLFVKFLKLTEVNCLSSFFYFVYFFIFRYGCLQVFLHLSLVGKRTTNHRLINVL